MALKPGFNLRERSHLRPKIIRGKRLSEFDCLLRMAFVELPYIFHSYQDDKQR